MGVASIKFWVPKRRREKKIKEMREKFQNSFSPQIFSLSKFFSLKFFTINMDDLDNLKILFKTINFEVKITPKYEKNWTLTLKAGPIVREGVLRPAELQNSLSFAQLTAEQLVLRPTQLLFCTQSSCRASCSAPSAFDLFF